MKKHFSVPQTQQLPPSYGGSQKPSAPSAGPGFFPSPHISTTKMMPPVPPAGPALAVTVGGGAPFMAVSAPYHMQQPQQPFVAPAARPANAAPAHGKKAPRGAASVMLPPTAAEAAFEAAAVESVAPQNINAPQHQRKGGAPAAPARNTAAAAAPSRPNFAPAHHRPQKQQNSGPVAPGASAANNNNSITKAHSLQQQVAITPPAYTAGPQQQLPAPVAASANTNGSSVATAAPKVVVPFVVPAVTSASAVAVTRPSHQVLLVKPLPAFMTDDDQLLAMAKGFVSPAFGSGAASSKRQQQHLNFLPYAAKIVRNTILSASTAAQLLAKNANNSTGGSGNVDTLLEKAIAAEQQQKKDASNGAENADEAAAANGDGEEKELMASRHCFCEEGYGFLLFATEEAGLTYLRAVNAAAAAAAAASSSGTAAKAAAPARLGIGMRPHAVAAVRRDYDEISAIRNKLYADHAATHTVTGKRIAASGSAAAIAAAPPAARLTAAALHRQSVAAAAAAAAAQDSNSNNNKATDVETDIAVDASTSAVPPSAPRSRGAAGLAIGTLPPLLRGAHSYTSSVSSSSCDSASSFDSNSTLNSSAALSDDDDEDVLSAGDAEEANQRRLLRLRNGPTTAAEKKNEKEKNKKQQRDNSAATSAKRTSSAHSAAAINADDGHKDCEHCTLHRRLYRIYYRAKMNRLSEGAHVQCPVVAAGSNNCKAAAVPLLTANAAADASSAEAAVAPAASSLDAHIASMRTLFANCYFSTMISPAGIDGTVAARPKTKTLALKGCAFGNKTRVGRGNLAALAVPAPAAASVADAAPAVAPHPPASEVSAALAVASNAAPPTAASVSAAAALPPAAAPNSSYVHLPSSSIEATAAMAKGVTKLIPTLPPQVSAASPQPAGAKQQQRHSSRATSATAKAETGTDVATEADGEATASSPAKGGHHHHQQTVCVRTTAARFADAVAASPLFSSTVIAIQKPIIIETVRSRGPASVTVAPAASARPMAPSAPYSSAPASIAATSLKGAAPPAAAIAVEEIEKEDDEAEEDAFLPSPTASSAATAMVKAASAGPRGSASFVSAESGSVSCDDRNGVSLTPLTAATNTTEETDEAPEAAPAAAEEKKEGAFLHYAIRAGTAPQQLTVINFNDTFDQTMAMLLKRNVATAANTTCYKAEAALPVATRHHTHHRHCVIHRQQAAARRAEVRRQRNLYAKLASRASHVPHVVPITPASSSSAAGTVAPDSSVAPPAYGPIPTAASTTAIAAVEPQQHTVTAAPTTAKKEKAAKKKEKTKQSSASAGPAVAIDYSQTYAFEELLAASTCGAAGPATAVAAGGFAVDPTAMQQQQRNGAAFAQFAPCGCSSTNNAINNSNGHSLEADRTASGSGALNVAFNVNTNNAFFSSIYGGASTSSLAAATPARTFFMEEDHHNSANTNNSSNAIGRGSMDSVELNAAVAEVPTMAVVATAAVVGPSSANSSGGSTPVSHSTYGSSIIIIPTASGLASSASGASHDTSSASSASANSGGAPLRFRFNPYGSHGLAAFDSATAERAAAAEAEAAAALRKAAEKEARRAARREEKRQLKSLAAAKGCGESMPMPSSAAATFVDAYNNIKPANFASVAHHQQQQQQQQPAASSSYYASIASYLPSWAGGASAAAAANDNAYGGGYDDQTAHMMVGGGAGGYGPAVVSSADAANGHNGGAEGNGGVAAGGVGGLLMAGGGLYDAANDASTRIKNLLQISKVKRF